MTTRVDKMMSNELYISPRFEKVVTLHILKNLLDNSYRVPLLLGIHGKPGDGKTFQCEKVLENVGVKSFLISGGQLEDGEAGRPAELIRDTYLEAGYSIDNGETELSAILINDIDTGLGDWGDKVQYTINRQTVFGELMHLVDYPNQVENKTARRIPIIMTGNDFSKLYEPLVRAGRMTSFLWHPTFDEKAKMVQNLFNHFSEKECQYLISELEKFADDDLVIAFFAHLKNNLYDHYLWNLVQTHGVNKLSYAIRQKPNFLTSYAVSLDELIQQGQDLIQSGQLFSHLKG